jgi:hypothetical protein
LSKKNNNTKKQYEKPQIKRVELRPEEAVLGFCKTTGQYGPGSSTCQTPSACYSGGS